MKEQITELSGTVNRNSPRLIVNSCGNVKNALLERRNDVSFFFHDRSITPPRKEGIARLLFDLLT